MTEHNFIWWHEIYESMHPIIRWILVILSGFTFSLVAWIGKRQLARIDALETTRATNSSIKHLRAHVDSRFNLIHNEINQTNGKIDGTNDKLDQVLIALAIGNKES